MARSVLGAEVRDVTTFFWKHLLMDMRVLRNALSSAEEEVALYLHQVIANIATRQEVTGMCVYSLNQCRLY